MPLNPTSRADAAVVASVIVPYAGVFRVAAKAGPASPVTQMVMAVDPSDLQWSKGSE